MGGATAKDYTLNWSFAARTGLALAGVDAVEELEAAFFAVGVDVVAQGAAAMVDGAAENQLDGAVEAEDLVASQSVAGDRGVDSAVEEGFIGVDVADAGDEALVEEGGFNDAAGFGKALGELGGADCERFGAKICVMCLTVAEPPDAAEASGIAEAQLEI